jgi:serine/threonine protein kinase
MLLVYHRLHIPEVFVYQLCYQVASALRECHSRARNGSMVLHRDLKPANIFLDAYNNAKIGDFGLARILQPHISYTKTCVGTPYYMSPVSLYSTPSCVLKIFHSLGLLARAT